jgi:alanyl-tRNA synthetase
VRRIEAVTGPEAVSCCASTTACCGERSRQTLRTPEEAPEAVRERESERKALEKA